jgi:16S rRNA (guanine527-N7)-methyltransferase
MSSTIIFHYFDTLSAKQREQFEQIGPIYERWNAKLNLVSRKDVQHIYLKHVLHALSIAKVISFEPNTQVLDIGTGGGFPGIPLAIMRLLHGVL